MAVDAGRRAVTAAVGVLAGPAVVSLVQRRRAVGQGLGGVGDPGRFGRGRLRCGRAILVARRFDQQRVGLELALDVAGQFQLRELQQLDRLLQLRRHHQRLSLAQLQARREAHRSWIAGHQRENRRPR
jgi:hypothetical protein